jgi:hypothetical protein
LKAYRRETIQRMHLYSDMHRFLPALAAATAGARITEIPVRHHARRFGKSKYGASRILKILADLLTLTWIAWFRERPLRLFGLAGTIASAFAALFGASWVFSALVAQSLERPWGYVLPGCALLWLVLAFYLLMLGFIGEVVLRRAREESPELLPLAFERKS